ncbi:MFS transporter, partial [Xanthomonas perforans]|nr:MFS transporter [Xanthomonas perforans]
MATATIIYWTGGGGGRIFAVSRFKCAAVSSSDRHPGPLPEPSPSSDAGAHAPAPLRIRLALFLAGFATFSLLY